MTPWTDGEKEMMRRMLAQNRSLVEIAQRLGRAVVDIEDCLAVKAEETKPAETPADAVYLTFAALCQSYDELGQRLKAASEVVSSRPGDAELATWLGEHCPEFTQAECARLAKELLQGFIISRNIKITTK